MPDFPEIKFTKFIDKIKDYYIPGETIYDRARQGRSQLDREGSNEVERRILEKIKDPEEKRTFPISRFLTSPEVGGVAGAMPSLLYGAVKKNPRMMLGAAPAAIGGYGFAKLLRDVFDYKHIASNPVSGVENNEYLRSNINKDIGKDILMSVIPTATRSITGGKPISKEISQDIVKKLRKNPINLLKLSEYKRNRRNMPQVDNKLIKKFPEKSIRVGDLIPTQKEFYSYKIKNIINEGLKKDKKLKPILISNDNKIIDGHHRWKAYKKFFGDDKIIKVKYQNSDSKKSIEKIKKMVKKSFLEKISKIVEKDGT